MTETAFARWQKDIEERLERLEALVLLHPLNCVSCHEETLHPFFIANEPFCLSCADEELDLGNKLPYKQEEFHDLDILDRN